MLNRVQSRCGAVLAGALALALWWCAAGPAAAHELAAKKGNAKQPAFDIVKTDIRIDTAKNWVLFTMQVSGKAGAAKPKKTGKFAGAPVFSYVWPTKIDPAEVGFDKDAGILALAVTIHPDFDDTPLFATTGADWHTHWVVLVPDEACGKDALKVKDIPEGTKPKLPKTWPGIPLLIDSPGYTPRFAGPTVSVRVPFDDVSLLKDVGFDGVTAGLQINASAHAPLLCVVNVFDVASGDLSLPGKAE
ncbi:hypothetical protein [Noviherbaspirillum sedimenti]|uniref:Uncharacterized protein n=1 Tax=Noviherbaspirillum sedimenti TaxID=2320865 RepID=A0A3A3GNQ7_9BURK|nr:hypothetical protein [Noviherbaspirillum sedimenti]RJG03946.1 hypothetical protein D3878_22070 [Noviherbaspirillum sedimenti]